MDWLKAAWSEHDEHKEFLMRQEKETLAEHAIKLNDALFYLFYDFRDIIYSIESATSYGNAEYKSMLLLGYELSRLSALYDRSLKSIAALGWERERDVHDDWEGWFLKRDERRKWAVQARREEEQRKAGE